MAVFTIATVAFYFLGAAVLHPQGLDPKGPEMVPTLSRMYLEPLEDTPLAWLRPFSRVGFLVGAWAVLFKTLYVATAANSRLTADFLGLVRGRGRLNPELRQFLVRSLCVIYPAASLILYFVFREPQGLIQAGGIAQALTLPFIAGAAIYLRYRDADQRVAPSWISDLFTALACLLITAVAVYSLYDQAHRLIWG
jgi:manganese transport protein